MISSPAFKKKRPARSSRTASLVIIARCAARAASKQLAICVCRSGRRRLVSTHRVWISDIRCSVSAFLSLEKRFLLKTKQTGSQDGGKLVPARVVIRDSAVVVVTRNFDPVLGSGELCLNVHKRFDRSQLRILFLQTQQSTDRSTKTVIRIDHRLFLLGSFVALSTRRLRRLGVQQT